MENVNALLLVHFLCLVVSIVASLLHVSLQSDLRLPNELELSSGNPAADPARVRLVR